MLLIVFPAPMLMKEPAWIVSPVTWNAATRSTFPVAETWNLLGLNEAVPVRDVVARGIVKLIAPVAPLNEVTPMLLIVFVVPEVLKLIAEPARTVSPVAWKAAPRSTAPAADTLKRVALKDAWIVPLCYYLQGRHGAQHPAHRRTTNLPPRPGCRSVLDRQLPKLHV